METDRVKLAYHAPFPPFALTQERGSEGLAIDILSQALARVHLRALFIPASMQKTEVLLRTSEVDGIAFWAIDPERQKNYDFSDPFIISGGALFIKSPNQRCKSFRDLEGRRVVTPGTGPLGRYIREEFPKVRLLLAEDYAESLKAVLEGIADAAALNIHAGTYLSNQMFPGRFTLPEEVFLEVLLAAAVLKSRQAPFLRRLNEGLERIRRDGTYKKITGRWLG